MISFKQFLSEKAMNPSEFKKVAARQDTNTLAGFEIECVVPSDSNFMDHANDNAEPDFMSLRDIDTFREITKYFVVSSRVEQSFDRDFTSWAEENDEEDTDIYGSGFLKFVKDHGGIRNFISEYDVEPRYGWASDLLNNSSTIYTEYPSAESASEKVYGAIARSMNSDLGLKAIVPGDARRKYDPKSRIWLVTEDTSIEGKGMGVEIISPPTPLGQALNDLESVFGWMIDKDIETNISTGFHANLSLPNIQDVDLVKLVLFMGESHVLKQFDRIANSYTNPQIRSIINSIAHGHSLPTEANEMIALAKKSLSESKYASVNISKMRYGYLEFRMVGNSNYHKDFAKIKDTILRFVSALEIACDKDAERNLYLKKLAAVIGKADATSTIPENAEKTVIQLLTDYGSESTMKELETWMKSAKAGKTKGTAAKAKLLLWVADYLFPAIKQAFVDATVKKPSEKQRAELKILLKRLGIDLSEFNPADDPDVSWIVKAFNLQS